jgi:phage terminase large subunit-like protein
MTNTPSSNFAPEQLQAPDVFSAAADIFSPPPLTDFVPLPHQLPPSNPDSPNYDPEMGVAGWFVWLMMAGRGSGKTQGASYYVDLIARQNPGFRIAIIAPTLGDARSACVDGPSGLLAINPTIKTRKTPDYYLLWPNGARADIFGAHTEDDVERLRAGGNRHLVWAEELAAWRYIEEAWDQMEFGLRLGTHPHVVVSTTPKNRPFMHKLVADPKTVVTTGATMDNPHLHESARERLLLRYRGTTIGRQELYGELLKDNDSSLWTVGRIDSARWIPDPDPERTFDPTKNLHLSLPPQVTPDNPYTEDQILRIIDQLYLSPRKVVVAVDPATTSNADSDSTGIMVVAEIDGECPIHAGGLSVDPSGLPPVQGKSPCYLVIADETTKGSPDQWAKKVVQTYHTYSADKTIAEVNNGGDLVEMAIRTEDRSVTYKATRATRGKAIRAEPVSALYEQGRVHHLGFFERLEDQMINWDPTIRNKNSPDRMDALVWGLTEIAVHQGTRRSTVSASHLRLVNQTTSHWTREA